MVAFQVNDASGQLFGNCKMAGNLAGKTRIPKRSERLWRCLLPHNLNHTRPRDKAGTWKSLQNCTGAEEIIVDEIGGQGRSFSPGGKSLVIAGMLGARSTSHLKDVF